MEMYDLLTDFEFSIPYAKDKPHHVLAVHIGWLNWGSVGDESFNMLVEHFDAEKLAELERPGDFYNFITYRERSLTYMDTDGNRQTEFPNSRAYYVHRDDSPSNLVLLNLLEPTQFGEIFIDKVAALLKQLNVERYEVMGAMGSPVPHTRPIRVTGRSSDDELTKRLKQIGVRVSTSRGGGYQGPTSIFNAISAKLQEQGTTTVNLMAHMPSHISLQEPDFTGVYRLLNVVSKLENIDIPLERLQGKGKRQYEKVTKEVQMSQSLSSLTKELEDIYDQDEEKNMEEETALPPSIQQAIDEALGRE